MSRYTRMLRKQAKAAAQAGQNGTNSQGKTQSNSSATLHRSPSDGVSTYIVAAGTNGSLVLHPLGPGQPGPAIVENQPDTGWNWILQWP